MTKNSMRAIIGFAAIVIDALILLTVGNLLFAFLLVCFVSIFAIMLCNYKNNAMMLAFLICFFVFLLGRPFVYEVFGYYRNSGLKINDEARACAYTCLIISLVALLCGYYARKKFKFHKKKSEYKAALWKDNKVFRDNLRKISFYATIITYTLLTIENILRFIHVRQVGYGASYYLEHDFAYGMPFLLYALAMCAPIAISIFLATLPTKREMRLPVVMFLLSNFASSISGNRFEVMASILAIIVYYSWRSALDKKKWISGKNIVAMVLVAPVLVLIMQGMSYWRNGQSVQTDVNPMVSFMYENGGSSSLIGAVQQYKELAMDDSVLYSFGGLWRNVQGSSIASLFGMGESYKSQTVAYAKNSHSLSAALTYYFFPTQYLEGFGLGGCYIAELYNDFSFVGVFLGNFLIGFLIGAFGVLRRDRIFHNFLCFFAITLFLRLPRDSFSYPLATMLNLRNVMFASGLYLIAKYNAGRQKKKYLSIYDGLEFKKSTKIGLER